MKESNQMLKIKQYTHQFTPLYENLILLNKIQVLKSCNYVSFKKNLFVETIFY